MTASRKREFTIPEPRERVVRRDARGRFIGFDDGLRSSDREPDEWMQRDTEPGLDEAETPTLH